MYDNKAVARRVLEEIFPTKDEAAVPDVVTDDYVNHELPPGAPRGVAGMVASMRFLHAAFSDQRWEIHQVIAEDDHVVLYCTHHGRHTGELFGLAPTGRTFAYRQMHIIRLVEGKGVESWAVRDDASLMRQLTAEQPAPVGAALPA